MRFTLNTHQLTVAELIAILQKLPQDSKLWIEGDYGIHHCEGARVVGDRVMIEIG